MRQHGCRKLRNSLSASIPATQGLFASSFESLNTARQTRPVAAVLPAYMQASFVVVQNGACSFWLRLSSRNKTSTSSSDHGFGQQSFLQNFSKGHLQASLLDSCACSAVLVLRLSSDCETSGRLQLQHTESHNFRKIQRNLSLFAYLNMHCSYAAEFREAIARAKHAVVL